MEKLVIVGSGASGVHFALSVLKKGYDVTMLDVGYGKPEVLNPEDTINGLKTNLDNPVDYFLGQNFEAFIPPDHDSEYYGFPPNKNYVFLKPSRFQYSSDGFAPLFSFAQGGFAEVWTGGAYPLNQHELSDFPFSYDDILPYYNEVAKRIGISGTTDDLTPFYPFHNQIMEPLPLDPNSRLLLSKYAKKKTFFRDKLNFYMGRSRVATLSQNKNGRQACASRGRCLWGCPSGALYTPSNTLDECKTYSNFNYISGMYVRHFVYNSDGRITHVCAESLADKQIMEFPADKFILAAGTLSSSKIFLESIYQQTKEVKKLKGLMDNRQVLMPFLNLKMVCKPCTPDSYQYHQVAMGIETGNPKEYIHGQITTLKSALIHPIIKSIPLDLKTSVFLFRNLHSALGLINLNFHEYRRADNYVSLKHLNNGKFPALSIRYVPSPGEAEMMKRTIKTVQKAFSKLGCIVPSKMIHIRPMGASVHYSGTIPMTNDKVPLSTSKNCQSNDFNNLYIVDGTTFPFLPAKNLTFTLMANATRVAENAF